MLKKLSKNEVSYILHSTQQNLIIESQKESLVEFWDDEKVIDETHDKNEKGAKSAKQIIKELNDEEKILDESMKQYHEDIVKFQQAGDRDSKKMERDLLELQKKEQAALEKDKEEAGDEDEDLDKEEEEFNEEFRKRNKQNNKENQEKTDL